MRAVLASLSLLVVVCHLGGCARAKRIGGRQECRWSEAHLIDVAPPATEGRSFVATSADDGSATLMVPVEHAESEYATRVYVVNDELDMLTSGTDRGYFIRAARREGDVLVVVALQTANGDCVYRELGSNGTERRRQVLLTADVLGCAAEEFAIDATHVARVFRAEGELGRPRRVETWRRSDFLREEIEVGDVVIRDLTTSADEGFYVTGLDVTATTSSTIQLALVDGSLAPVRTFTSTALSTEMLRSTPHGDLMRSEYEPRDTTFVQRTEHRVDTTTHTLEHESPFVGLEAPFVFSTDAQAGLAFIGNDGLEAWTHDRITGEDTLAVIASFRDDDIGVSGTGTTVSSANGAYVFWHWDGGLYGAALRCD